MIERRVAHRYDLSSPILDGSFTAGSAVELTLSLPLEITRGIQILVRASGKVVRVDGRPSATEPCGVAVVIQRYDIINPSASLAAA